MKRYAPRITILILFTVIGVLVGMEWTRSGIERVYGPLPDSSAVQVLDKQEIIKDEINRTVQEDVTVKANEQWDDQSRSGRKQPSQLNEEEALTEWEEQIPEHLGLPPLEEPPVNKLADNTAGLLSRLSDAGINAVVGVFDGLF